jgi:hypothetical protein
MALIRCLPVLVLSGARLLAGGSGSPVEYVGGTLALPVNASGRLDATGDARLALRLKQTTLEIPYDRVNLLEYGQKVSREYVAAVLISPMFLLAKKRKHFLTLGYTDEQGRQQAIVLRVEKNHVRSVLASLEARTGRKVTYQDEEARKAGKG